MRTYTIIGLIREGLVIPERRKIVIDFGGRSSAETLNFPSNKPWNKGQIKKHIREHYGCTNDQIVWPDNVKVP